MGCYNQYEVAVVEIEPVRKTRVYTPELSPESYTYTSNGYVLSIPEAEGATSYQWICTPGTIQGTGTYATLYSDCNSTVSVRDYNSQCQIYSDYDSELMTINYGPIAGPQFICSSNETYTLQNAPTGTISWSVSPGTLITLTTGNGSSAEVHLSSCSTVGNEQIIFNISTSCGIKHVSRTIIAGGPDPQDVDLDIYKSTGGHANKHGST